MHANRVRGLVPAYNGPVWHYSHDHDTLERYYDPRGRGPKCREGEKNLPWRVSDKVDSLLPGGGGKGWGLWGKFPVRKKSLYTSRSWTGIVVNIKRSNLAGKGGLGV